MSPRGPPSYQDALLDESILFPRFSFHCALVISTYSFFPAGSVPIAFLGPLHSLILRTYTKQHLLNFRFLSKSSRSPKSLSTATQARREEEHQQDGPRQIPSTYRHHPD